MNLAHSTTLNIDQFLVGQSNGHFISFGVGLYPLWFALVFLIYGGFHRHLTRCQRPLKARDANVTSHKAGLFSPFLLSCLSAERRLSPTMCFTLLLLHGSQGTYRWSSYYFQSVLNQLRWSHFFLVPRPRAARNVDYRDG